MNAEASYGMEAGDGLFVPYGAFERSGDSGRHGVGASYELGDSFGLDLKGLNTRSSGTTDEPERSLMLRGRMVF